MTSSSSGPLPSRGLTELLSKALLDGELCDMLFTDPDRVAQAFALGPVETQAIKRLDRHTFEQRAARLRSA